MVITVERGFQLSVTRLPTVPAAARKASTSYAAATASLSWGRVAVLAGQPLEPLLAELVDDRLLDAADDAADDEDDAREEDAEEGDDEAEDEDEAGVLLAELAELALPEGTEHSFTPPAMRPPNVASLQLKLPLRVL
jgi:hypothetical protein